MSALALKCTPLRECHSFVDCHWKGWRGRSVTVCVGGQQVMRGGGVSAVSLLLSVQAR